MVPDRLRGTPFAFLAMALVAATVAATVAAAIGGGDATASGVCLGPRLQVDGEAQAAVALVNAYRAEHGLSALRISPSLNGIATWMVEDIAASGHVEHTDSLGRSAYTRAVACGYNGGAGENLAAGAAWDRAGDAVNAWKASSGHDANLLGRYYTEIGVARLHRPGSIYGWYWALEFGTNAAGSGLDGIPNPGLAMAPELPRVSIEATTDHDIPAPDEAKFDDPDDDSQ